VADTHLPKGRRRVPAECVEALRACDVVVHAGDFISFGAVEWFTALGPELIAVSGNVDDERVQALLPEERVVDLDGFRLAVVHDAGPAKGRLQRMRGRFPDASALVFGHSHMPLHEVEAGFEIFNPGSPTERRRAPRRSFGVLELDRGQHRFRHVWL
jgi:uncharacterized protein